MAAMCFLGPDTEFKADSSAKLVSLLQLKERIQFYSRVSEEKQQEKTQGMKRKHDPSLQLQQIIISDR